MISRIGTGFLTDKFSPWTLGCLIATTTSLAVFVFWGLLSGSYAGLLAFSIAYGTVAGGWSSLFTGFVQPHASENFASSYLLYAYVYFIQGITLHSLHHYVGFSYSREDSVTSCQRRYLLHYPRRLALLIVSEQVTTRI